MKVIGPQTASGDEDNPAGYVLQILQWRCSF
jgi:hypothetical protein